MGPPAVVPLGLQVARTAKTLGRAFEQVLAEAGGSLPIWLVLLSLKAGTWGAQNQLADAVGIRAATLTHHLNGMEAAGLVIRRRDASNRRVQHVEPTPQGDELFGRLRTAAAAFDRRLRAGVTDAEAQELGRLLERLSENAGTDATAGRPAARRRRRVAPPADEDGSTAR